MRRAVSCGGGDGGMPFSIDSSDSHSNKEYFSFPLYKIKQRKKLPYRHVFSVVFFAVFQRLMMAFPVRNCFCRADSTFREHLQLLVTAWLLKGILEAFLSDIAPHEYFHR